MSLLTRGEQRRLAPDDTDWSLGHVASPITRTRGGGSGRPNLVRVAACNDFLFPEVVEEDVTESATGMNDNSIGSESDGESLQEPAAPTSKPTHTRVILEVSQLEQAFQNFPCPDCGDYLELKLRTTCIASYIQLVCNNNECNYISNFDKPCATSMHVDDKGDYERMTEYAINVLYVLGFISMGDGHTEAGRLLGLLGLPNDTTMMNRSFGMIEERVAKYLRELANEIMDENIYEEARQTMSEIDFNVWKQWKEGSDLIGDLPWQRWPHLDASYDMAWQQKGSGNVYSSQSGHGSLFGRYSRKIIGIVIKSKLCSFCNTCQWNNPDKEVPFHDCFKNH